MKFEEGKLDLFAVVDGRLGVELDRAQGTAIATTPAAVLPWSHDQDIGRLGAGGLDALEGLECSKKVFGIEPTTDRHYGRANLPQMRPQIAGFPEIIIR